MRPCRLWRMVTAEPIIVVPYDEAWPSLYQEERARIERAIGPWVEDTEQVAAQRSRGWLQSRS